MTRTMYDSTNPAAIPADAEMVAGYVDGKYEWTAAQWSRFTTKHKLGITVTGAEITSVIDVETGDVTPAHVPGWIADRKKAEAPHRATVYCNRSTLDSVKSACQGAGFALGHDYVLWVATLDGTTELPDMTGVVAIQDKSAAMNGADYDSSVVVDDTWYAGSRPAPVPAEEQQELAEIIAQANQVIAFAQKIIALASE